MAKIPKKFYLDPEADSELLERLSSLSHGDMSKTVVLALRRYFFEQPPGGIDLAEIRQMFETVLDSKLAGLQLANQSEANETESPGGLMNRLGDGLLLE